MEESANNDQSTDNKKDKPSISEKHGYSIITAIIIALLTCGYLFYILPNNEVKENAKNIAVLKGIEQQLKTYIDDQVKYIDTSKMKKLGLLCYKDSSKIYIKTISINKKANAELEDGIIKLPREIQLSGNLKKPNKSSNECATKNTLPDNIDIDLAQFLTKINSSTHFTSFYIYPIEKESYKVHKALISQNVSLIDQDSLIKNNRKNGPLVFKKSSIRYYADQIEIPNTNYSIFIAVGIDNSTFQTNIRQIDNGLLIFSLLLVIILILGINFIKPIVSSYKERLSQTDLVSVAFSIGILIAVLVVFGIISYWDTTIKTRSKNDLRELVERIDKSFSNQIIAYKSWRNESIFKDEWEKSEGKFAQIYLDISEKIKPQSHEDYKPTEEQIKVKYIQSYFKNFKENQKVFKYLDNYFRMDNKGLITTDLNTSTPEIRRNYAERMYFKILQQKNTDNKIDNLLTAVYSREHNEYQWIYAEKSKKSDTSGINGIAFKQYFSEKIILPQGTSYMIVDKNGDVLMQNDSEKNLSQNLLDGSKKSTQLESLLSGISPSAFEIEYQGTPYQVYGKKLDVNIDSPVYIIGMRDLSHVNRLSLFTFTNGFLISLFYGFFILVITYIYSALFYAGRLSLLSNQHFYHLFPDNTRTHEYKQLLIVNSIAILLSIIVSLISSPSISFIFCIIIGISLVVINLITLNIRTLDVKKNLINLIFFLLVFAICIPLVLILSNRLSAAIILIFGTHISLVFYYRTWRKNEKNDLEPFKYQNKGVNRKAYTGFMTARLMYHFAVFPFVLISAFYINELNDFARYYCSSNEIKELNNNYSENCIISAYSCNCATENPPTILLNSKDDIVQKTNIGFFDRPATFEIKKFSPKDFTDKYYLNSTAIMQIEDISDALSIFFIIFITFFFLTLLVYNLLNYYSNRFFFYDLMQATYEKYYLSKKSYLANNHIFIPMVNNHDIKELIQVLPPHKITIIPKCNKYGITIDEVFDLDNNNEISPFLRMNFILNYNHNKFSAEYNKIWKSLPEDGQTRSVLYDFAQDQFVNYKNKGIIMDLMEKGIIDCHPLTGRLKMMNLSFRIFILSKSKQDKFITKFKDESKNGTFSKLKIPIFIVAISALLLLMYLNKDSYDRVAVMGGSIVSVIALLNKFLEANKSL